MTEYLVTADITLYAIYKKDISARFYSGENTLQTVETRTLFNNEKTVQVTAPEPSPLDGWTAAGWRNNKYALEDEYKSGNITISDNTDFYAVYSRNITVTEKAEDEEEPNKVVINQYRNSAGGMASGTVMLE